MKKPLNIILVTLVGFLFLTGLTLFVLGILKNSFQLMLVCSITQIILVTVAIVYIKSVRLESDRFKKRYHHYKNESQKLQSELDALKRKRKTESTHNSSSVQPTRPNTDNTSKGNASSETIPQPEKIEVEKQPAQDKFNEYYSSPNANGVFDRGYAKPSLADDSFYKVSGKLGETQAKVELLQKKDYKRLFDFKSDCLYPVCEITNNRQDGTSIIMIETGCVNLQENKWIIDNKKKIKIRIE